MTRDELEATLIDHLLSSGVPKEIAGRVIEPLYDTPAVVHVRDWWKSDARAIVLSGGNGCGKSIAAASIIRDHCQDNSKRAFIREPGDMPPWWIWRGMKWRDATSVAKLGAFDHEDKAEARTLIATPLLILDEAGNEMGQGETSLGNLLADRLGDTSTRTIVTTNLSPQNFSTRYGSRLMSRLGGIEAVKIVHSKDLRLI
jgi:DNA replication protein DnaC